MEISLFPKSAIHLLNQIAQIPEYPISGTGFSSKPAVNRQQHFVRLHLIAQCLIPIRDPYKFLLATPSADINVQLCQGCIHLVIHGVGLSLIRSAFDGNGSLVVVS